jgi:hypothetical protein
MFSGSSYPAGYRMAGFIVLYANLLFTRLLLMVRSLQTSQTLVIAFCVVSVLAAGVILISNHSLPKKERMSGVSIALSLSIWVLIVMFVALSVPA